MSVEGTTVVPFAQPQTQVPDAPQKPADPQDAPPPAAAEKKPDEYASKFAALAKKERIARQAIMLAKEREAKLAERERIIAERERSWEDEFKQSPLDALKKRNLSYEDLTKAALNGGKFEPDVEIKGVKDEIARLRQEQEAKEKAALEAQEKAKQEAEAQVVEAFRERIGQFVKQNAEKYELTALFEGEDLVFQTIEKHFEDTKKVLSIDEASDLVEKYLEDELDKTTKTKKFQAKYLTQTQSKDAPKASQKNPTTLTNEFTSSAPSILPAKTENERIKRALAALG